MRAEERGALANENGRKAEEAAARYLEKKGYQKLKGRYRCRFGEIDLIMKDGDQLVFVEVKFRKNSDFGTPAEAVSQAKQRKLQLAARSYLREIGTEDLVCRFDLVEIVLYQGKMYARHTKNMIGGE